MLLGPTRLWYKSLPIETIHDFNQLQEESVGHFIQHRKYTSNAQVILRFKQLEDYIPLCIDSIKQHSMCHNDQTTWYSPLSLKDYILAFCLK